MESRALDDMSALAMRLPWAVFVRMVIVMAAVGCDGTPRRRIPQRMGLLARGLVTAEFEENNESV